MGEEEKREEEKETKTEDKARAKRTKREEEAWRKWQGYTGVRNGGREAHGFEKFSAGCRMRRAEKGPGCQHGFLNSL